MQNKVFAVLKETVYDGDPAASNSIRLFSTPEKACDFFSKQVEKLRSEAMEDQWKIFYDSDSEFGAGVEGEYNLNHSCVYMRELIVE